VTSGSSSSASARISASELTTSESLGGGEEHPASVSRNDEQNARITKQALRVREVSETSATWL
jgi:hypothetical protein